MPGSGYHVEIDGTFRKDRKITVQTSANYGLTHERATNVMASEVDMLDFKNRSPFLVSLVLKALVRSSELTIKLSYSVAH